MDVKLIRTTLGNPTDVKGSEMNSELPGNVSGAIRDL